MEQSRKLETIANQSKVLNKQVGIAKTAQQVQNEELDLDLQLAQLQAMANQTKILQGQNKSADVFVTF